MKTQLAPHYDLIVIGDHPAALWGAVQMLNQGAKVLVVAMGTDRVRNLIPKFATESLELGSELISRDIQPIQVLSPEKRFRVFSSPGQFSDEYEFVYGKNIADFSAIDDQLIRGMAYLYRGFEANELPRELKIKLFQDANEMVHLRDEPGLLRKHFETIIDRLGGHRVSAGNLHRIFVEKKSFIGVQVEGATTMITASRAWIASSWNLLQTLISEGVEERSHPSGWEFEISVKVSADAIPVGLTSKMVFIQEGAPVVEFDRVSKEDFTLRTVLPFEEMALSRAYQRKISQRLLKLFGSLVPDLEYNLIRVFPDIRDPERAEQVDLVERYPFQHLDQIPVHLLRYAGKGLSANSSVSGMGFAYEEVAPADGEWSAYRAVDTHIQEWIKATTKKQ